MAQLSRPKFFAKPFCVGDASTEVLVAISFEELDADAVFSFFQNRGAIFPARARRHCSRPVPRQCRALTHRRSG